MLTDILTTTAVFDKNSYDDFHVVKWLYDDDFYTKCYRKHQYDSPRQSHSIHFINIQFRSSWITQPPFQLFNCVFSPFWQFSLTPLHLACWYGQESVVKLLLEHGANVNAEDRVRWGTFFYFFSFYIGSISCLRGLRQGKLLFVSIIYIRIYSSNICLSELAVITAAFDSLCLTWYKYLQRQFVN